MPKITFSNGFKAEKTNYSFASTYYGVVVKPWILRVGDNHPEARTAAKNALLIAKEYKYDLALLERLIQGLNSAIGYSPHWDRLSPGQKFVVLSASQGVSTLENHPAGHQHYFMTKQL